jgi:hypothetical protein
MNTWATDHAVGGHQASGIADEERKTARKGAKGDAALLKLFAPSRPLREIPMRFRNQSWIPPSVVEKHRCSQIFHLLSRRSHDT